MIAEIISIGEEILIGQTINTNAAWMASRLNEAGIKVRQVSAVTDEHGEIIRALKEAAARAGLVITTGGLGPTRDDITKAALCDFFGTHLELNKSVVEDNRQLFARRGLPLTRMNRLQAMVPASAAIFRNPHGTAPGLWFDHDNKVFVSLPGVPHEMKHMFEADVMPALEKMRADFYIVHRTILTHGIGESFLAEKIAGWEAALPAGIALAYLPSPCL